MTKYFYYAVMRKENGKEISFVKRISQGNDLLHVFRDEKYIIVEPCNTKKEALETANFWNECSFKNGKYLFNRIYPAYVDKD